MKPFVIRNLWGRPFLGSERAHPGRIPKWTSIFSAVGGRTASFLFGLVSGVEEVGFSAQKRRKGIRYKMGLLCT